MICNSFSLVCHSFESNKKAVNLTNNFSDDDVSEDDDKEPLSEAIAEAPARTEAPGAPTEACDLSKVVILVLGFCSVVLLFCYCCLLFIFDDDTMPPMTPPMINPPPESRTTSPPDPVTTERLEEFHHSSP